MKECIPGRDVFQSAQTTFDPYDPEGALQEENAQLNASSLEGIVDLERHPLGSPGYRKQCRLALDQGGSLLLHGFLLPGAIEALNAEALDHAGLAYYCEQSHSAYLDETKPQFSSDHPANRQVSSSKGCITDDQIPGDSLLRVLYNSPLLRQFLCAVLGEQALHEYADPLSSINVHYYRQGQELGWHFDNSSFALTLMLAAPDSGGRFEYIPSLRDQAAGDMNYPGVADALDGKLEPATLDIHAGTLALFRGRNSLHRVTPVEGDQPRIQVVLAYNAEPGISLAENARMTFYGRTG